MCVQARVRGPHPGVRLTNRSYSILHCPRADRSAAGSNRSGTIALCKELEKGHDVPGAQGTGVELQAAEAE